MAFAGAGAVGFPPRASEYVLLEEIGRGAFAVVYRAICKPLDVVVAVKRVDLETCNGSLESVGKEAHFMSLVDHPNVMKAYCSFNVDHFLWVVMPYMDGGSCLHIMKVCCPDGLEESLIAVILKETLKGLNYLHQQQLIHRDIKAGNILINSSGSVKLGDFGTSAYMFGQGGGERVRKTFTGTPCWMAPEVMEQTQGYDFRADIWSFGITALELAHGHAPFSKYPPMKVLLMTIQNAPPTLDQERDKRFSRAFREMVKLCLNKDPSRRPTAEKLLKHPFFKHAKSDTSQIQKNLHGLGPLWEREKMLRDKDAALLASKKPAYLQEEERSRVEYKRGVSCWNFDVENLKHQAAMEDDEGSSAGEEDGSESGSAKNSDSFNMSSPNVSSPSGRNMKQLTLDTNQIGRRSWHKQPKQIGRFGVFEGDLELESPGWHEIVRQTKDVEDHYKGEKLPTIAEHNKGLETPEVSDLSLVSRELDDEIPEEDRCSTEKCETPSGLDSDGWDPALGFSGNSKGERTQSPDRKPSFLERSNSSVIPGETPSVQEVCRESKELRKSFSMGDTKLSSEKMTSIPTTDASSLPASLLVPHLKNLLLQTANQYETLADLLKFVRQGETIHGLSLSAVAVGRDNMEILTSDLEKHDQIIELQNRVTSLTEELLAVKLKNFQLERQLNAIYNRHEEERIRREEAEKEYI